MAEEDAIAREEEMCGMDAAHDLEASGVGAEAAPSETQEEERAEEPVEDIEAHAPAALLDPSGVSGVQPGNHDRLEEWLSRALADADTAALLLDEALQQLSSRLVSMGVAAARHSLAPMARQVAVALCVDVLLWPCQVALHPSEAVLLDVIGPILKTRVLQCCRAAGCNMHGKAAVLTSTFGATTAVFEQLHLRMVRAQVSFAGESDVVVACAKQRGFASRLPKRLRLYLSQLWYMWRLCLRTEDLQKRRHQAPLVDLMRNVGDVLAERWDLFAEDFDATTADRVRRAGMCTDVHVFDGNAKNGRLVCAAALRHTIRCTRLKRCIRTCCLLSPLLGSKFCSSHCAGHDGLAAEVDNEMVHHEVSGATADAVGDDLRLQLRRQGTEDVIWVSESTVHPSLWVNISGSQYWACARGRECWLPAAGIILSQLHCRASRMSGMP